VRQGSARQLLHAAQGSGRGKTDSHTTWQRQIVQRQPARQRQVLRHAGLAPVPWCVHPAVPAMCWVPHAWLHAAR